MLNDGEDPLANDGAGPAVLTKADLIAEVARITELPEGSGHHHRKYPDQHGARAFRGGHCRRYLSIAHLDTGVPERLIGQLWRRTVDLTSVLAWSLDLLDSENSVARR
jgi:hypothetical protein